MRAMTYNIQHGLLYPKRERIDLSAMAAVIREAGADFCALNEIRGKGSDPDYTPQAQIIAQELGWHFFFAPAIAFDGGPYGNALVSRYFIKQAEIIPIPDPVIKDEDAYYETRSILRAILETEKGDLTLLITHMGLAKAEQRNAVSTLFARIETEKAAGHALVVMGDFNMTPEDPILSPLFSALKDTTSLTDPEKTFPSDTPRSKIDYILTHGLTVSAARILPVICSDHRPVIADIAL